MAINHAGGFNASFKAGADLDTTTSDFRPVRINSSNSVNIAQSTTHRPIGILQNRPNAGTGASCNVRAVGFSKLTMNDTCTAGDTIVAGSGGAVRGTALSITAATSRFGFAIACEASAATGTVIDVLINHQTIAGTLSAAID